VSASPILPPRKLGHPAGTQRVPGLYANAARKSTRNGGLFGNVPNTIIDIPEEPIIMGSTRKANLACPFGVMVR